MNISWELNATTIVLLAINLVGLIWFAFSTQATAAAAHKKADHAHERISALAEAESKFREKIFLEYVNRDILREMEARLERIEHLARTSAEAIDRLGDRLDGMSDVRRRPE
jgi:FixJ family two-component response regulator